MSGADKMEIKISDKIMNTIVLYQPVASDIRKIFACYRIIISLERIGDMVVNIMNFIQKIKTIKMTTPWEKYKTDFREGKKTIKMW